MLAVLKAGGRMCPSIRIIHAREIHMLKDSGAEVLLTKREYISDVVFNGTVMTCLTNRTMLRFRKPRQ